MRNCNFKKFKTGVEIIENEIHLRVLDFNKIEGISSFVNNPFQQNSISANILNKISKLFDTSQFELELQLINILNNFQLRSVYQEVL